jgi:hypothetical protein
MDRDTPTSATTATEVRDPFALWLSAALLAVNVLGVLLYLKLASAAWAIPEERAAGINTVTGEPFVWALSVVPVWGTFLLVNVAWMVVSRWRGRRIHPISWLVVVVGWVIAVVIDFADH